MLSPAAYALIAQRETGLRCYWRSFRRLTDCRLNRQLLDDALGTALLPASDQMHLISTELKRFYFYGTIALSGLVGFGTLIFQDHFNHPDGKRFSLLDGISAWPAEIIR